MEYKAARQEQMTNTETKYLYGSNSHFTASAIPDLPYTRELFANIHRKYSFNNLLFKLLMVDVSRLIVVLFLSFSGLLGALTAAILYIERIVLGDSAFITYLTVIITIPMAIIMFLGVLKIASHLFIVAYNYKKYIPYHLIIEKSILISGQITADEMINYQRVISYTFVSYNEKLISRSHITFSKAPLSPGDTIRIAYISDKLNFPL